MIRALIALGLVLATVAVVWQETLFQVWNPAQPSATAAAPSSPLIIPREVSEGIRPECKHLMNRAFELFANDQGTSVSALAAAVTCDPSSSMAWLLLGNALTTENKIEIDGTVYRQTQAFARALQLNPDDATTLSALGSVMPRGGMVTVRGERLDRLELSARSLRKSNSNPAVWLNVAIYLSEASTPGAPAKVEVDGIEYTAVTAAAKAAQLGNSADALAALGHYMSKDETVRFAEGDVPISRVDVLIRALERDPNHLFSWRSLAFALARGEHTSKTVNVGLDEMSAGTAFRRLLEKVQLAERPELWRQLGDELGPDGVFEAHDGTEYRRPDAYYRATRVQPKSYTAWASLCEAIPSHGELTLYDGTILAKRECYRRMLKYFSAMGSCWNNFATELRPGEAVNLQDKWYTPTDLFVEAVRRSPRDATSWSNLAGSIEAEGTAVELEDRSWKSKDLQIRALQLDPALAQAWQGLSRVMADDETADVNGETLTRAAVSGRATKA